MRAEASALHYALVAAAANCGDGCADRASRTIVTTSLVEVSGIDPAFEETLQRGIERISPKPRSLSVRKLKAGMCPS